MKAYYKVTNRTKNSMLVEVEVIGDDEVYGRKLKVIRPVSGEGHIRVRAEKIIIKKY